MDNNTSYTNKKTSKNLSNYKMLLLAYYPRKIDQSTCATNLIPYQFFKTMTGEDGAYACAYDTFYGTVAYVNDNTVRMRTSDTSSNGRRIAIYGVN